MNDRSRGERTYVAIDLKSFYASVECRERGLDPLTTNLVVADVSRTEKTICLAVSPSLKALGIPGRARLFEVVQALKKVNQGRLEKAPGHAFTGESFYAPQLEADPGLKAAYIAAMPRMGLYIDYSTRIYRTYLKYAASEDIHVYSIDEVMMDITDYLKVYGVSAHELTRRMIRDVFLETGITATAGIGTNLYLAKVAMDIVSKHVDADEDGVRIAQLDEYSYRQMLWQHRPLTDFWRVGRGYSRKLEERGILTMGDIARCSLENEDLLYDLFGINAELLIDHAWGWEPCTMAMIKSYRPESSSTGSGQVLPCPYSAKKARIVVHEMADALALDLVEKKMTADQVVLTVIYDRESLSGYTGEVTRDWYGREMPKSAHGTANLGRETNSSVRIDKAVLDLYDRIVDPDLLVRRIFLTANHVTGEKDHETAGRYEQMDLFTDYAALEKKRRDDEERDRKEHRLQEAMLSIRQRYGKNAVLKGLNLQEGATGKERNEQIGGHKA